MAASPENRPAFVSAAPRFLVRDMEEALAFYGRLSFETTFHGESFAVIKRDRVALHLNTADGPVSSHSVCWIAVTNIEALYQDVAPISAIQTSALKVQPWGFKEFFIQDPSRNLIIFGEPLGDDEATTEQTA